MTYQLTLSPNAKEDLVIFIESGNKGLLKKIFSLFEELKEHPYSGTGRPEPLKYELSGKWSRRITSEHRMVFRESMNDIYVLSLRYHYPQK